MSGVFSLGVLIMYLTRLILLYSIHCHIYLSSLRPVLNYLVLDITTIHDRYLRSTVPESHLRIPSERFPHATSPLQVLLWKRPVIHEDDHSKNDIHNLANLSVHVTVSVSGMGVH